MHWNIQYNATTWENIANLILSEIENLNLPISKLRG